jgi:hypothetical protein
VSEKEFLSQLKEHQNIIYKLVHLYATSEEDKKDLYQEILFQAWKTYSSFREMQSSAPGYTGYHSTPFLRYNARPTKWITQTQQNMKSSWSL